MYKIEMFRHWSSFYNENRFGSLLTNRSIASHIRVTGDCSTESEAREKATDYAIQHNIKI